MGLFDVTYTIEADSKNEALALAYSNIYLADLEVVGISVRERKQERDRFAAFGEEDTRRISEPFDEKGMGDV